MWVLENEKFYNFLKQMREGKKVLITFIAPKGNFECTTTCLSYNCILHEASKKESLVVNSKKCHFQKRNKLQGDSLNFKTKGTIQF